MEIKFKPTEQLTVSEILNTVDEAALFQFYIGPFEYGKAMISPLRPDEKTPSFYMYVGRRDGNPIFMDYGTGIGGDIFTYLQIAKGLSRHGVEQMILADYHRSIQTMPNIPLRIIRTDIPKPKIEVIKQPFTKNDIRYWAKYGVTLEILTDYCVSSCRQVIYHKNGESTVIRRYSKNKPIYAYHFGKDSYKIYSPYADKKHKWLFTGTRNDIEGFDNLPLFGDILIITKSLKDVMTLKSLGYDAISLQGEGNRLPQNTFDNINKRFNNLYIFYDNDKTGVANTVRMCDEFKLIPLYVPVDTGCKDISDHYKKYGKEPTSKLMKAMLGLN